MSTTTGIKPFLKKETPTSLERQVVDEFIEHARTLAKLPSPSQMEQMLLSEIRNRIDNRNNSANKDDLWSKPSRLSPWQIAALMIEFDHVRSIKFVSKSRVRENDLLGMYQPNGKNKGLYVYDENDVKQRIAEYSASIRGREVDEAYAFLKLFAPAVERCADIDLIPVNNGIFNYKTKKLQAFSPEYVFLSKPWVDYDPTINNVHITMPDGEVWDCESWMQSLVNDNEQLQFHWELISAVLRPNVPWNKSVLMYSTHGNNGKGSLIELMRNLVGYDSYASIPLNQMSEQFALAPLLHAQAILVDENDVGTYVDKCSQFKLIVTGDDLAINRKHKSIITAPFRGMMIQCVNEYPRFKDRSESLMRRIIIDPFEKQFTGVERKYIKEDYLQREDVLKYFLKRALESDFYELSEPQICKDALVGYRTYSDPVAEFWDDVKGELVWDMQPFAWLYELYKKWHECTHPKASSMIPSRAFREKIAEVATADGKWECPGIDKTVRPSQMHSMAGTETLILTYGVESFMNPHYVGKDSDKVCDFPRKEAYKGCLLRVPAVSD